jgi:hypothetical protein
MCPFIEGFGGNKGSFIDGETKRWEAPFTTCFSFCLCIEVRTWTGTVHHDRFTICLCIRSGPQKLNRSRMWQRYLSRYLCVLVRTSTGTGALERCLSRYGMFHGMFSRYSCVYLCTFDTFDTFVSRYVCFVLYFHDSFTIVYDMFHDHMFVVCFTICLVPICLSISPDLDGHDMFVFPNMSGRDGRCFCLYKYKSSVLRI